jgi:hypothetical protein
MALFWKKQSQLVDQAANKLLSSIQSLSLARHCATVSLSRHDPLEAELFDIATLDSQPLMGQEDGHQ